MAVNLYSHIELTRKSQPLLVPCRSWPLLSRLYFMMGSVCSLRGVVPPDAFRGCSSRDLGYERRFPALFCAYRASLNGRHPWTSRRRYCTLSGSM